MTSAPRGMHGPSLWRFTNPGTCRGGRDRAPISSEQRFVQKPRERRDAPEHGDERAVEPGTRGKGRREFTAGEKLPEFQELGGFVILRESARHALQPFAVE